MKCGMEATLKKLLQDKWDRRRTDLVRMLVAERNKIIRPLMLPTVLKNPSSYLLIMLLIMLLILSLLSLLLLLLLLMMLLLLWLLLLQLK